jgi:hypothetical protein
VLRDEFFMKEEYPVQNGSGKTAEPQGSPLTPITIPLRHFHHYLWAAHPNPLKIHIPNNHPFEKHYQ